jgi:hypothetical protein
MKSTINSRFAALISELYKGNKRAFAQAIDVSPTVIENVVGTRQGKPSYDVIEKVCANANVSPEWLLTGNGPMLRNQSSEPQSEPTTIMYERDPRDIQLITAQEKIIARDEELIAALRRQINDPSSARSVPPTAITGRSPRL